MPTTSPLRGGLIGCGFVSGFHLEAWKGVEGARIVALCDLDPERLDRALGRHPDARTYRDAGAMFAAESLDFVEICTRPASHRRLVESAAMRGVHVLCQKPAAIDRPDLLAMIAVTEAGRVRLMFHENWRFRPWYRALKSALVTGAIGRPIRLRLSHHDTRALRPDGFDAQPYFATMPELILLEMGCHLVDSARFLLGEVASVTSMLRRFGGGHVGEDLATLLLAFENESIGLLDMSWCAATDRARPEWALNETIVEGTLGTIRLLYDGTLQKTSLDGRDEILPVPLPPAESVYIAGYAATQTHFIEGLRYERAHETSGVDTLKTMDVVWTAYRAASEGRTLPIDH